jgi:hypothetical protein
MRSCGSGKKSCLVSLLFADRLRNQVVNRNNVDTAVEADPVAFPWMPKLLYDRANQPKTLHLLEGVDHNDL